MYLLRLHATTLTSPLGLNKSAVARVKSMPPPSPLLDGGNAGDFLCFSHQNVIVTKLNGENITLLNSCSQSYKVCNIKKNSAKRNLKVINVEMSL